MWQGLSWTGRGGKSLHHVGLWWVWTQESELVENLDVNTKREKKFKETSLWFIKVPQAPPPLSLVRFSKTKIETTWCLGTIFGGKDFHFFSLSVVDGLFFSNVRPPPMTEPNDSSASCKLHLIGSSKVRVPQAWTHPAFLCLCPHGAHRRRGRRTYSSSIFNRQVGLLYWNVGSLRAGPGSYLLNSLSVAVPDTSYSMYCILSSKSHLASCHHQLRQCQAGIISSRMLTLSFLFQSRPCCRIVIINAAYRPCARPFVFFFLIKKKIFPLLFITR